MPISREALLEAIKNLGDKKVGEGIDIVSEEPGSDKPSGAVLKIRNPYGAEITKIDKDGKVKSKEFDPTQ